MDQPGGYRSFEAELAGLAAEVSDARVVAIHAAIAAPLRIAVGGRPGVGHGTVARALRAAGVRVTDDDPDAEVFVVAEVVKPEDRDAITSSPRPKLVVLNKADLSGFGAGGPMAAAAAACARYSRLTGVPTVPMVAHLAVAEVDQDIVDALRVLAAEPADLASADGFVDRPHPLPASVRRRLLDELDLFGIAHGVLALRDKPGAGPATVRAMLRRRSGLDGVCAALPLAEAGYRRIRGAVDALETMAVTADPATAMRVGEFLAGDAAVIARMACALEVMGDSGLDVERGDDALAGAVRWERYTTGPVGPMHQACGADIARGSLRIWRRAATR